MILMTWYSINIEQDHKLENVSWIIQILNVFVGKTVSITTELEFQDTLQMNYDP